MVYKSATRTKFHITSRISPPIPKVNQTQVMQQKTSPWESMPEMRNILVMEMREGKIYPTLVLEGGFIFGKHMNLQWVCGQSLSAFPYPQTTSSQGWIPREILAALWHVIGKFLKLGNFFLLLMGIFVLVAGLWTAPQTDSDCIKNNYVWFAMSCIQVSELKDFWQLLLIFNIWFLKLLASSLNCQ